MNPLSVAVLFVAVATASASGLLGADIVAVPVVNSRGALEGALGGQWIPDVPVAYAAPSVLAAASIVDAGHLGFGLGVVGPLGQGYGAPLGLAGHGASRALEGALGGQWIPDTLEH